MRIFGISDLHLPSSRNKPMDVFGEHWKDYVSRVRENWLAGISPEDLVLMPGDLSWAMRWSEAAEDIEFLKRLPGFKVLVKGNHDFWIQSENKAKRALESVDTPDSKIRLLHNNALVIDGIAIAGTRGWSHGVDTPEADERILNRELIRLEASIKGLEGQDYKCLIIMTHFPATKKILGFVRKTREMTKEAEALIRSDSGIVADELYDERFWEAIKKHTPAIHVFGHVHNKIFDNPMLIDGIRVYCLSADAIDFDPVAIEF
jgi:predicted phosphohydrolase